MPITEVSFNGGSTNDSLQPSSTHIIARIPAKFFNLNLNLHPGSVKIASVSEADRLQISTHGGDVDLGKSQAAMISVSSRGGSIKGSAQGEYVVLFSGDARMDASRPDDFQKHPETTTNYSDNESSTNGNSTKESPLPVGGDIKLNNVRANSVFLSSTTTAGRAGRVGVKALYADNARIGGGDVNIETLFCTDLGYIQTQGESADIGGIDGSVHIHSEGKTNCKVM